MSTEIVLEAIAQEEPFLLSKIAMAIRMTEAIDPDFALDTASKIAQISEYTSEKVAASRNVVEQLQKIKDRGFSGRHNNLRSNFANLYAQSRLALRNPGVAAKTPNMIDAAKKSAVFTRNHSLNRYQDLLEPTIDPLEARNKYFGSGSNSSLNNKTQSGLKRSLRENVENLKNKGPVPIPGAAPGASGSFNKTAGGWADWGKGLAAMGASTLAGSIASDLYDVAKRGLTASSNFKRIVDSNEQLGAYEKKDVKKAFDTLHRFAPEFTADPSIGGQIIHRMMETPHDQHNIVKDFLAARNNLRNVRKSQFSMGAVHYETPEMERHELAKALESHKAERMLSNQKSIADYKGTSALQEAQEKIRSQEKSLSDQKHKLEEAARDIRKAQAAMSKRMPVGLAAAMARKPQP